jgi:prepilin-type N-terminal cleavage/methylation domain-containing protein
MRKSASDGFTLIELLVSVTVLALLVVMLMGLVDSATKLWRENENHIESYREARAALNLIASDLRSMHVSTNSNYFYFEPTTSTNDGVIAFLTSLPISAQHSTNKSDLCSVGYFLAKGRISDIGTNATNETWNLYRYFLQSNDTFAKLKDDPSNLWPLPFTPNEADTEIVARNIRSFQVKAYTQTANRTDWMPWTAYSPETPLPSLVELRIEAVNTEARKRFGGEIKQDSPALTNQTRVWTTRIYIPSPVVPQ